MKLGFLTSSINDIEKAARLGFDSVELNVRAVGDPTEGALDAGQIEQVKQLVAQHNVSISALAYYDLAGRGPSLFNKEAPSFTVAAYERDFADPDGRVRATLEIVWLSGWAPHESQQKPLKPGSAEISLTRVLGRGG